MTILTGNFNLMNGDYGVYIANLGAYNCGIMHGSWLKLPAEPEEIEETMQQVFSGRYSWDYDREYAIHDYALPFRVDEYEGIERVNELLERLENKMQQNGISREVISYLADHMDSIDDVLSSIEEERIRIFYNCESKGDACYEWHEECGLVNIPDELLSYFDFDSYARDLSYNGVCDWIERVNLEGTRRLSTIQIMNR